MVIGPSRWGIQMFELKIEHMLFSENCALRIKVFITKKFVVDGGSRFMVLE